MRTFRSQSAKTFYYYYDNLYLTRKENIKRLQSYFQECPAQDRWPKLTNTYNKQSHTLHRILRKRNVVKIQ